MHVPVGDSGDGLDPGFRIGAILGGRVLPELSLNGEIAIDVMNPSHVQSGVDVSIVMVDFVFSPLFHFGNDHVEGFVGPRIGGFLMEGSSSYQSRSMEGSASGIAYGLNVGFAINAGKVALGAIFSYTGRHAMETCTKFSGSSETCDTDTGDDFKEVTAAGLVMF
jgi:hypothetical protein